MKRTLLDLYGAGILFFYYIKIPLVIGLPILYLQLDYKHNIILDVLWIWCFILIIKDIINLYKKIKHGQGLKCDSKIC